MSALETALNTRLAKQQRIMLTMRRAVIKDRQTGATCTAEALPKLQAWEKELPKLPTVEAAARDGQIEKIYDLLYRQASIEVHSTGFSLSEADEREMLRVALPAAIASLEAVLLIAENQIVSGRQTEPRELFRALNIEGIGGD